MPARPSRRRIREIDPGTFKERKSKARTLTQALDDGWELTDRRELIGHALILIQWELRPAYGSTAERPREYARVWALMETTTGEARRVKFEDAGNSIPTALRELEDNGVTSDVSTYITGEEKEYTDADTGEEGTWWTFEFTTAEDTAENIGTEDPDF
jgi:hypothetical protein